MTSNYNYYSSGAIYHYISLYDYILLSLSSLLLSLSLFSLSDVHCDGASDNHHYYCAFLMLL